MFLVSANTGEHTQESRTLRFWFRKWLTDMDKQAHVAQDFFTKLVSPKDFPRGKKIEVLMNYELLIVCVCLPFRLRWFY